MRCDKNVSTISIVLISGLFINLGCRSKLFFFCSNMNFLLKNWGTYLQSWPLIKMNARLWIKVSFPYFFVSRAVFISGEEILRKLKCRELFRWPQNFRQIWKMEIRVKNIIYFRYIMSNHLRILKVLQLMAFERRVASLTALSIRNIRYFRSNGIVHYGQAILSVYLKVSDVSNFFLPIFLHFHFFAKQTRLSI